MKSVLRIAFIILVAALGFVRASAQVSLLWESPTLSGEMGTLYSPADSSYSYIYTIDTLARQMRLYSTTTFTALYTMSNVRPYEYPAYLLPDMNGNSSPEVILQYYSLPGYSVSIRDAATGQTLYSWSDATNSYYIWHVFQSPGNRTLKLAMRKTNVSTLAASFVVYSLGVSSEVGNSADGVAHSEFRLAQNYPNPFNPATTIRYTIADAAHVQITVYDADGRLVRAFDCGNQEAGQHEILWNGRNDHNMPVATGVYYYSLTANNATQTKRMILLR